MTHAIPLQELSKFNSLAHKLFETALVRSVSLYSDDRALWSASLHGKIIPVRRLSEVVAVDSGHCFG